MSLNFGYYPRAYDKRIGKVELETLPSLPAAVAEVVANERRDGRWIFAPGRQRVFALPKTHLISYSESTTDEHLQFLVWCFGFFVGMRLTTTQAGFLDATPIDEHAMIDINWIGDGLEKAIAGADEFW